jgi:hypothetical protein
MLVKGADQMTFLFALTTLELIGEKIQVLPNVCRALDREKKGSH